MLKMCKNRPKKMATLSNICHNDWVDKIKISFCDVLMHQKRISIYLVDFDECHTFIFRQTTN